MKVLIVSFDKTLTDELKNALADHEVYVAKNSEEAIKMIPADVEGVIYDAISGAISEEDINTLYTKKFSNARYVILYDELFPVDEANIIVPQKLLMPRDESPRNIVSKLIEFPEEAGLQESTQEAPIGDFQEEVQDIGEAVEENIEELVQEIGESPEIEIEPTSYEMQTYEEPEVEESIEITEEGVEEALQEIEDTQEVAITEESQSEMGEEITEAQPAPSQPSEGGKILIVSFDQTLIDSIKASFGQKHEVVSVKTVKQAIEQGGDASVVVFDAISGVIAEKGLIELSENSAMANKPYIILVDDLFPINVEGIPLENKTSISRDMDPSRIKEMIEERLSASPQIHEEAHPTQADIPEESAQVEEPVDTVSESEELPLEESVPTAEEGSTFSEEESPVESIISQDLPEIEVESEPVEEVSAEEEVVIEEEAPALEALEKIMEEQGFEVEEALSQEEAQEQVTEEVAQAPPTLSLSGDEIDKLMESAVAKALSEEKIREAVSKALEDRMVDIRDMVADVVRREVEKVFEELDIRNLIRQATYQALKDRLEELIT